MQQRHHVEPLIKFKIRSYNLVVLKVRYEDIEHLMTPRKGQKCWLCKKVELIPGQCYEILLGVDRGTRNRCAPVYERKKFLVCDCLCSIDALKDIEIISFGDGVRLPDFYFDGTTAGQSTPEFQWDIRFFGD